MNMLGWPHPSAASRLPPSPGGRGTWLSCTRPTAYTGAMPSTFPRAALIPAAPRGGHFLRRRTVNFGKFRAGIAPSGGIA
jgi:hypothetical protein